MAKNGIFANYDDPGFPAAAAFTANVSFAGGPVKAAPGRLHKVIVTTAFVGVGGQLAFYDNPAAVAAGTPLLTIPVAAGLVGAVFDVNLPAFAGIAAVNSLLTAGAVTVGYA